MRRDAPKASIGLAKIKNPDVLCFLLKLSLKVLADAMFSPGHPPSFSFTISSFFFLFFQFYCVTALYKFKVYSIMI